MKKFIHILQLFLAITIPLKAIEREEAKRIVKTTVYASLLVGAALSFYVSLPKAQGVMEKHGFWAGVGSGYIPRLAIDAVTMGVCIESLYSMHSKKDEDLQKLPVRNFSFDADNIKKPLVS